MSAAPRLSVYVPTYNRAGYLAQALATLLAQRFADFEVVVVDNASTDGTAALVAGIGDPRVRYERNARNVGSIANWNRCLDVARGELVAICHDDDLYHPDFLARGVAMLDDHPRAAFVHTAATVVDPGGRPLRVLRASPDDRVERGPDAFVRYLRESHDVVMSTVIARRAAYEAVERFSPEQLCADFGMWLRLALQGDVAYIATPLVSYRTHAGSTSLTIDPGRWYRENEAIVRAAVAWGRPAIPGIETREAEFVDCTRRLWARRTLREALFAASFGNLATARQYLAVSRALAGADAGWPWRLAAGVMNPVGARLLRGLRVTRRSVRYVG